MLSGFTLLSKPCGVTSFKALDVIKKKLPGRKVGHTGTLDKFAEGLLIVLIGKYTRLASFVTGMDKEYEAVFTFGEETATLDPEGDVVKKAQVPSIEDIKAILPVFTGIIKQKPPKFSAVHINGERAYSRVLKGDEFDMPEREITVHSLKCISYDPPCLTLKIRCSKGTYIRSIARDMGIAAGSCAYVSSLKRNAIGPFSVENAVQPSAFDEEIHVLPGIELIKSMPGIETLVVKDNFIEKITRGIQVTEIFFDTPPIQDGLKALFNSDYHFLALVNKEGARYRYNFVGT